MEKRYELLMELFGVESSLWNQIHERFSPTMFCPENRKDLIAEYLIWEDFVNRAKKVGFVYYYGIDEFLSSYKKAVYNCLTI